LVWIDAPQARLLDPAVEAFADETAPAILAALHRGEHAVLELRSHGTCGIRFVVQRQQFILGLGLWRNQRGAPAGQEGVVDPALGALPVADAAPILELRRH